MENSVNNGNEKISIIVPIYNSEKYLNKSINSIINQSYKNLEILLINDGSTDNSGKICDDFSKIDNRIKVIHKDNEGVSATKNLGIKICTGNYIAFVDSDDIISPDYCETLYSNMIKTNSDISIVSYNVVREDGSIITGAVTDNGLKKGEVVIYEDTDIVKELLLQKTIKNFVCKLYKKSVMCDFPIGVTYEDIVFSVEVLAKAKRVVYINKKCYNYLKRKGSITATISEKNLIDFATAISGRYKIVKDNYPSLASYNIYAFLESTVALSIKNVISERKHKSIDKLVIEFTNIIKDYVKDNEKELLPLLNDYQKLCLYLMKYNLELYYSFLKERQRLKVLGLID